jgi:D-beta-D-heptose 7-phosphate kinase / D-beta-D-heptose 1-phosphate adenosyltransferase
MKEQLRDIISSFSNYTVLVIGDAILDTYIKGVSDRICREAPVPVINVQGQEHDCGGAANTAINVAALGAKTYFLSVTGRDEGSRLLLDVLTRNKVHTSYILRDTKRTTLAKKRVMAASSILLRIDEGNIDPVTGSTQLEVVRMVKKLYRKADAVILSDYGYGVITDAVVQVIEKLREEDRKPLIIDSKDLSRFKKLSPTIVKPNYEETIKMLGLPRLQDSDRIRQVAEQGRKLLDITGARYVAATMDAEGALLFEKGKKPYRVDAIPQDNRRAIGAGDTFIGTLALSFCAGASARFAVHLASAAASIVL